MTHTPEEPHANLNCPQGTCAAVTRQNVMNDTSRLIRGKTIDYLLRNETDQDEGCMGMLWPGKAILRCHPPDGDARVIIRHAPSDASHLHSPLPVHHVVILLLQLRRWQEERRKDKVAVDILPHDPWARVLLARIACGGVVDGAQECGLSGSDDKYRGIMLATYDGPT
jgi:hypothetical protein